MCKMVTVDKGHPSEGAASDGGGGETAWGGAICLITTMSTGKDIVNVVDNLKQYRGLHQG